MSTMKMSKRQFLLLFECLVFLCSITTCRPISSEMDKMDQPDLPPLVYGMDGDKYLYCEFASRDKYSRPLAYSPECRKKNPNTSMWVDGEELQPFHVSTLGQNAFLLECPPLEDVKSTHCSEGWRVYSVCSFECQDGFEATVETVECVVMEPLDNITAVWSPGPPCRELPSRKIITEVDKAHPRGGNNDTVGPRPEGGKTDTVGVATPGKVKEEDDGSNGKTIIIAVLSFVGVCCVLGVVVCVYWKRRKGNSDAGSPPGPSVISSVDSIRKPGDCVIADGIVADDVVADDVIADGAIADGGAVHDEPAMGLSDRHIFSMESMSYHSDPQMHVMQHVEPCEGKLNEASPLQQEQMKPLLGDDRRMLMDKPRVSDLCDASMKEFEELGFNAFTKLMEKLEYHQQADKASTLYGYVLENYKDLNFSSRRAVEVHQHNACYRGEGDTPCEYFWKRLSNHGVPIRDVLTYLSRHSKESTQAILEAHDCEACREEFGFDESQL